MTFKTTKLRDAITFAIAAGATALAGTGVAFAQDAGDSHATTLDRIEVTGSRIKRAEIEGAVPVTVIDRAQLEATGDISVADFLRDTAFNSFGSYQSSSGSSWGGFTGVSLRGLGEDRTLILIDGRRAPVAPMHGSAQDLNTIPMAAVERIEILSDGASAIYGSDALGGVVNIITRKDFDGVEISYGQGFPTREGGDTQEGHVVFGTSGDRGRILAGASYNKRDTLFTRDRDFWMAEPGASVYSNNFWRPGYDADTGEYYYDGRAVMLDGIHPEFGAAVPGDCTAGTNLFYTSGSGYDTLCQYNHSMISTTATSVENNAAFIRADYQITDDWNTYFNATISRARTFGRYASVPSNPWPGGAIILNDGDPNHPGTIGGNNPYADEYQHLNGAPVYLTHRFAAGGPRDGHVENTVYDYMLGFEGRVGVFDVDFGMRHAESRATDLGENYVVGGLAQQAIDSGAYNIYDPFAADPDVLKGFTATISRDMKTTQKEIYASAAFDMFEMGGGTAAGVIGAEYREDYYQDNYDPLSEAGQIVGSAGNSAAGSRDLWAAYVEMLFPIVDSFEVNIAGRYDSYSDYGHDFSPKVSLRWHPIDSLTFRASYGEGFRAPGLDILTAKPSFSASFITHPATCLSQGLAATCETQINEWRIANPDLESEQSKQFGLGVVWDAADWINMSLDYYNIKIDNQIAFIGASSIVACLEGTGTLCPSGLSQLPDGTQLPDAPAGLGVIFGPDGSVYAAQTGYTNIGNIKTQGYDFTLSTNFDFAEWGGLRNHLSVNYVSEYSVNGARSLSGRPSYPRIRAGLGNQWTWGDLSATWNINYIHGTQSQAFRQHAAGNTDYGLPHSLPSWTTHDVQLTYKAPWNADITLGVKNLADKEAVIDPWYEDFDDYLYNTWGRIPYFRYTQRF